MSAFKQQRIVVLMGGASAERDISLASGQAVFAALQSQGLDVIALDLAQDTQLWQQQIVATNADVAFITLHGTYGEDGCVQGLLEAMQLPYTGSKVLASALCMHKKLTKDVLAAANIQVAQDAVIVGGLPQTYPLFVKPVAEGSSVGLFAVPDEAAWLALPMLTDLNDGELFADTWLVEPVVEGREVAVSVLHGQALPVVEVVPKSGTYDYAAKYTKGATAYFCPARLPEEMLQKCQDIAEHAVSVLGCAGAPRVDLIVPDQGEPVVLEVNTIPGMTSTSLLPKAAAQVGMGFADLCVDIVRQAACVGER